MVGEAAEVSTLAWLLRGLGVFALIFTALMARSALQEIWAWLRELWKL